MYTRYERVIWHKKLDKIKYFIFDLSGLSLLFGLKLSQSNHIKQLTLYFIIERNEDEQKSEF